MNIPKGDFEEILLAVVSTVDSVCFASTGLKGKYACYIYWSVALIPKAYIKSLNKNKVCTSGILTSQVTNLFLNV